MDMTVSIKFNIPLGEILEGTKTKAPKRNIEQFIRAHLKTELSVRAFDLAEISGLTPDDIQHVLIEADLISLSNE